MTVNSSQTHPVHSAAALSGLLLRALDLAQDVVAARYARVEGRDDVVLARELAVRLAQTEEAAARLGKDVTAACDREHLPDLAAALGGTRTGVLADVHRRLTNAAHNADRLADWPGMDYLRGFQAARCNAYAALLRLAAPLELALTHAVQLAADSPPPNAGPDYTRDFAVAAGCSAELSMRLRQTSDHAGLEQARPKLVVVDLRAERELAATCAEALTRALAATAATAL
ncbi:hypothetical protein ABH920_004392 [Catenulispora sp. EB89]|uniref:hypothetical protein n=1 Tax=Catenulispora sp. EB89 TaxID=3156257 RepID=UPI003510ECAF